MKYLCCIDDTDKLESLGTGALAEAIRAEFEAAGWGKGSLISRHQLLIHPDIPYTSHNSSMCFIFSSPSDVHDALVQTAGAYLDEHAAEGSDPGLCIASVHDGCDYGPLVEFGIKAKQEVLTKTAAYRLAEHYKLHLSEHGGSGQGVIGALAGVGLRLGGSDGEIKGALKENLGNGLHPVRRFLEFPEVEQVLDFNSGRMLGKDEFVLLSGRSKTLLHKHKATLFVYQNASGVYECYEKTWLRNLGELCAEFSADAEEEWRFPELKSCYNCRYRRWTADDFHCLKGISKDKMEERNEKKKKF